MTTAIDILTRYVPGASELAHKLAEAESRIEALASDRRALAARVQRLELGQYEQTVHCSGRCGASLCVTPAVDEADLPGVLRAAKWVVGADGAWCRGCR